MVRRELPPACRRGPEAGGPEQHHQYQREPEKQQAQVRGIGEHTAEERLLERAEVAQRFRQHHEQHCAEPCAIDSDDCPSGFECLPYDDDGACWPADDDGEGGGGGCAATGGAGAAPILLGVGLAALLRRRRKR